MSPRSKASKNNRSSIRYWWIPLEEQSFESDNHFTNRDAHQDASSYLKSGKCAENKSSSNRISTSQFVSAVVGLWDIVGQPPAQQAKESLRYGDILRQENSISHYVDSLNLSKDFKSGSSFSSSAKENFENLKNIKRSFVFEPSTRKFSNYNIWSDFCSSINACRWDKMISIGLSSDVANENGSTITKPYLGRKDSSSFTRSGCIGADESFITGKKSPPADQPSTDESFITGKKSPPADQPSTDSIENNGSNEGEGSFGGQNVNLTEKLRHPPNSLFATYSLESATTAKETTIESTSSLQPLKETVIESASSSSGLHLDYDTGVLTSAESALGQCQKPTDSLFKKQSTDTSCVAVESFSEESISKDHSVHENCKSLIYEDLEEGYFPNPWLSVQDKFQHAFAKNRHALAGALAGTMVSLCLHPVDTVKTIIQANGQLSSYPILKTVLAEKGVLGLYRGIASNITCSAPISAIYTYTYESVKGALLPVLPKEYHSFAHCIAGGSSSLATSFVFTPSERIKQQMQVGLRYQNCWNALIGCLEKGGLSSLYAGWGAVLCRNIPHSIIKFYTYENLKQFLLTSAKPDASLSTVQTLASGGLAGSTAALFTTPFDVVKTRLQTQVPGSLPKYDGVLHALQEIARQEGLQGLYRGLTPRLAMYVSQGAIFFSSYEFLKAVFSLESQQASPRGTENEENVEDPSASRLQTLRS